MKKVITILLLLIVCVSSIRVDEIYAASSIRLNKDYVQGTIGKTVKMIYIPYQKLWFITRITIQKPTNRLKN